MKISVNINDEPVILLDGLTLDDLKAKYSWIFNAKIKNAILGEVNNTLVWYMGEWIDGEWLGGIWYSGIWHRGIWERGTWHAYNLDRNMLLNGTFKILEINDEFSTFKTGTWQKGDFYQGKFGLETELNWINTGSTNTEWLNGTFHNGQFMNSLWVNGDFKNGMFYNSWWKNGNFYNGTFQKHTWETGNWYGGDFIEGIWYNGVFNQTNRNVKSRFGVTTNLIDKKQCIWKNGTFSRGEFHSGLHLDSEGNVTFSTNNEISKWEYGIWKSGDWYGGHFERGEWFSGTWHGGVWGTWVTEWKTPEYITQRRLDPFSGNTDTLVELTINDLSATTDFYEVEVDTLPFEMQFSGTTYSTINQIDSFSDNPPYYYYTNFGYFETGVTTYNFDSEFTTFTTTGSTGNPWNLSVKTPTSAIVRISGGTLNYDLNTVDTGTHIICEQQNLLIPEDILTEVSILVNSWSGYQDSNDKLTLRMYKNSGGYQDIELISGSGLSTIQFKTEDVIERIELLLTVGTFNLSVNQLDIEYLRIGDTTYFYATDVFDFTGTINMECSSNTIDNTEGDIHELLINAIDFDNIDNVTIRLLNKSGETVAWVYEEEDMIIRDYYDIRQTGSTNAFFFEDTDDTEVFFNITAQRKIWNQPYSLRLNFHANTYRRSRIETIYAGEQIYEGDIIKITTTAETEFAPSDGNNTFKYWLTNENNEQISNILYLTGNTTLYTLTDYLTGNTFANDYKVNMEIYRDNTSYLYEPFNSEINFESFRYVDEVPWHNLDNIIDGSGNTYAYFNSITDRNLVNLIVVSGFSFDLPDEDLELKGFKLQFTRSGFYEQDETLLGGIKDRIVSIDFEDLEILKSGKNNTNNNEYSKPISYSIETIDYGQYEDFFGFSQKNWSIDKVNNDFRLFYQPKIFKSLRLSPALKIEGRIYSIVGRAFYQTKPIWYSGLWKNGLWINGEFRDGTMLNANWIDGEFIGIINSEI